MERSRYSDPHTPARLAGLKLRAWRLVEGFVAGLHRSPHAGWSVEFAEHREYTPGDDPRYLDWKLLARSDKLHVKRFEDETNLIAYFALDISGGMTYRGADAPLSKLEFGQLLIAALAGLVLRQQDAVALATMDSAVRVVLRPTAEAAQWDAVVNVLEHVQPTEKTALAAPLAELASRWNRRGVVMLVTDAWDDPAAILAGVARLTAARHDVLLWHVVDEDELQFPFRGPLETVGLEGELPLNIDAEHVRESYRREVADHCRTLEVGCRSRGAEYLRVTTAEPVETAIARTLARRAASVR